MNYKAIMTLGAAALCGSLLADVTSANCVGYGTFKNESNPKVIIGTSFTTVGTESGILLNDLKGTFATEDSIQVSKTDPKGKTILYTYLYSLDGDIDEDDGWYDEELTFVGNTERLEWGQGAWLVANDPTDLTTAGEVKKGHKIHAVTDPKTLVCSFYPTPFCPNAATVTWVGAQTEDSIQTFYTEGGKTKLYTYLYSRDGDIDDTDGWYDEELTLVEADKAIAGVGEGFWYIPNDLEAVFSEVSPLGDEEAK